MPRHSEMLKELFPQAQNLFDAAEDNSRARCESALAFKNFSTAEKVAAVHIAAEAGSYEAAGYMLQTFAKSDSGFKMLRATYALVATDESLQKIVDRYGDTVHTTVQSRIESAHKMACR